jgi:transcription factor VIP1
MRLLVFLLKATSFMLNTALNEALREEVQRLKIAAAHLPTANGNPFNQHMQSSFFVQNQPSQPHLHYMGRHPAQHLQLSSSANSNSNSNSNGGQPMSAPSPIDSMDFM